MRVLCFYLPLDPRYDVLFFEQAEFPVKYSVIMGPRWHSGYSAVLQIGRSLVRFRMVSLEFFINIILPIALPGVDTASNRNDYQEYFLGVKSGRCVRLTTLLSSWAIVT